MRESIETRSGRISELRPNELFLVQLDDGERVVCHIASDFKLECVRLIAGDRVEVTISVYDKGRGRIVGKAG